MPIRILHLIGSNFIGGPEKQILRHAHSMRGGPFEIWVGSFREDGRTPDIVQAASERSIPHLVIDGGLHDFSIVRSLTRAISENRIDMLCSHHYKATILGYFASRKASIPQVAFVRGWTSEGWKVALYAAIEKHFLRKVDHVVCVSLDLARRVARQRGASGCRVIRNAPLQEIRLRSGSDIRDARRSVGIADDMFLVLAAGRLSTEKGHSVLLQAATLLLGRIPRLKILVFGDGPKKSDLLDSVSRLGIASVVEFPGFTAELPQWLRAADLVVNPSYTEGVPNVLLEAVAQGVPIVATAVGGVPELFHKDSAMLVPAGDPEALANAIHALYADLGRRNGLAQRAAGDLRQAFAGQQEAMVRLYQEISAPVPRGEWRAAGQLPSVAVVVPVLNEGRGIRQVLSALCDQDYPAERLEIIVADGGSTDDTVAQVNTFAAHSPVRLVENPLRRSGPGRNAGIAASLSDVVIFVDGHCHIPSRSMVRNAVRLLRDYNVVVVSRPQPLEFSGNSVLQQVIADCRAHRIGHGADSTIFDTREQFVNPSSAGAIYDRTVFRTIGTFDERFDACEDVEFNTRIAHTGERAVSSGDVAVYYQPRRSLSALFRQLTRYGEGRMRLVRKHPGAFTLPQTIPALFVIWLCAGILAIPATPFRVLWLASLALYGVFLAAAAAALIIQHGITRILAIPVFLTIHVALGIGFCREFLRSVFGKQPFFFKEAARDRVRH